MNGSDDTPRPLDPGDIELGADLTALTERLAENAHETWARERLSQGWSWGPERDDARKLHPCLVPYAELPEEEKAVDRAAAMGTVRAIVALGGSVEVGGVAAFHAGQAPRDWADHLRAGLTAAAPGGMREGDFDMDDGPEIEFLRRAGAHPAADALSFLRDAVSAPWRAADAEALRLQRHHRQIAAVAIWSGISGIVLAIGQLALAAVHSHSGVAAVLGKLEMIAVIIAVLAVVFGLWAHKHHGWLGARQKAERLRMVKFQAFARPELWSDVEAWKNWVTAEVTALSALTPEESQRWVNDRDQVRPELPEPPCGEVPAADLMALADYYRLKRLEYQRAFFLRQSDRANRQSWIGTWKLSLVFFGLSVLAVAVHNVLHLTGHREGPAPLRPMEVTAISLAAVLPVIGFGFRAWLAAFESPRSRNLYRAKTLALDGYIQRSLADTTSVENVLHHIAHGEHFFTGEHREWCRLQMEAEWFA